MSQPRAYAHYWRRKELLRSERPHFPVLRWWEAEGLCEIEAVYCDAVRGRRSLLDVGAGDLRFKAKLQAAGFQGRYETQDIGHEAAYTFASLSEVTTRYDAIVCLDVMEHLALEDGLALLDRMLDLLAPGGVLILQTPNAWCVRNPAAWDMTHVHLYNLPDLWAYCTAAGYHAEGFRVRLTAAHISPGGRVRFLISAFFASYVLGLDYADNIALIVHKPPGADA